MKTITTNYCVRCGLEPQENPDTGLGAVCAALERKDERNKAKEAIKKAQGRSLHQGSAPGAHGFSKPKTPIMAKCSDGETVSQRQIDGYRHGTVREMLSRNPHPHCWCGEPANDPDHTIAQARCKVLHKTELIWDDRNIVFSCRLHHGQWEAYKSGKWLQHENMAERLAFVKEHDPEGFARRVEFTAIALGETGENTDI